MACFLACVSFFTSSCVHRSILRKMFKVIITLHLCTKHMKANVLTTLLLKDNDMHN